MVKKYFSIDIGGTYIKYSLVDRSGDIELVEKKKTPSTLEKLKDMMQEIVFPIKNEIRGIGVSCPGKVNTCTGTVYNGGALPFLHEFSFKAFFQEQFDLPCSVINDGKAAALSEVWMGNLKDVENGVAIVLGTGIGGGIILGGQLVQGSHFQAGELSFLLRSPGVVDMNNMMGFTGSAVYFIKDCAKVLNLEEDDGIGVFRALEEATNPRATLLFENYCREIAVVIMNLQATFDMEKVVIGGGVSAQGLLLEEINRQYLILRQSFSFWDESWSSIIIEACKFKNNANLLGAIYQLLLQFEQENID